MADSTSKTVRVRVAVVVDVDGDWGACGWPDGDAAGMRSHAEQFKNNGGGGRVTFFNLDVPLPLPSAPTVEGEVKP